MITIAMIFVALVLFHSHITHGLELEEIDINNIFNNVDVSNYEKRIDNENLIKLINKVTQKLYADEQKSSKTGNKNMETFKKRFVKPHWLKLYQKQGWLNDQLHGIKENEFYEDVRSEPNDFSKVYLILNPESTLSTSDVRDLTDVISSMFSNSVFNKKTKYNDETMRRHKGLIIRDKRRRFKEFKETFAKDSIERDYKSKRVRNDYGGGGRTAIPYIRHRGDIYERD